MMGWTLAGIATGLIFSAAFASSIILGVIGIIVLLLSLFVKPHEIY